MNRNKQQHVSPENYIRTRARNLPLGTCYINDNWRDTGTAMIVVTRNHINGNITHGNYIVDLFCLGVKESKWIFNQNTLDFDDFMLHGLNENELGFKMIVTSYVRVHNIIYGAVEYAGEFGFSPHKSFALTKNILEEDDDRVKLMDIEFGFKEKPLYISSPQNPGEMHKVLAHLDKRIGRDNYYFITAAEADDFFEKEDLKDLEDFENIDFHDPDVKKKLINELVSATKIPKNTLARNPEKMFELIGIAEDIFFHYMVTAEQLNNARETIARLFDFNISDEIFSDDLLFGNAANRDNIDEVRTAAGRLIELFNNDKIAEGLDESNRHINEFFDIPVFQYLKLLFLEMTSVKRMALSNYKFWADKYPGYLPFVYKYAMAFFQAGKKNVSRRVSESFHLKNFYPGKDTFCRHEVLLYTQLLVSDFSSSSEFAKLEMIHQYLEENHPGLIPGPTLFVGKMIKLPVVIGWCEAWLKEQK